MILIRNNPSLSEAFQNEELKKFFLEYLTELEENPYVLKNFLINGAEKSFEDQMKELSKSFRIVKKSDDGYECVERAIDGHIFRLGNMVVDEIQRKHSGINTKYPISRIYEDGRGLHIRLDIDKETFKWRNLSSINHN